MKNRLKIYIVKALSAAIFSSPLHVSAQNVEGDDEVFELNPFVVSTEGDDRYYASNAISATQLNTPIRDMPFSLEVITSEFTRDIGANDFKESLAYSAGVFTETYIDTSGAGPSNSADRSPSSQANVSDRTNNAIVIRGYNAPFQQRMGFRVGSYIGIRGGNTAQGSTGAGGVTLGSLIDSVNVDRSEVVRGPGSLLYGLGVISGVVNVMPKRPRAEPGAEFSFTVGRHDYYRGTVDITGPLIGRGKSNVLNYRLLGAWQDNGDWTDFFHEERDYEAFQLEWLPLKGMTVFGEVSRGRVLYEGHQGTTGQNHFLRDANSVWSDPLQRDFVNEYGERYRWGAEDFAGPFADIRDPDKWDEIWTGTGIRPEAPDPAEHSASTLQEPFNQPGFSIYGPDTWYERVENSALINMEWAITKQLAVTMGGFFTRQETEEFTVHPQIYATHPISGDGTFGSYVNLRPGFYASQYQGYEPIPREWIHETLNPGALIAANIPVYRGIGSYWMLKPAEGESRQTRIAATYTFQTPFIGGDAEHTFLFGRQDIRDQADVPIGNPLVPQIFSQSDWEGMRDSRTSFEEWGGAFQMRSFYDWRNPFRYEGQPTVRPARDYFSSTIWYTGHYAIYSGKFFRDRLTVIGGWRHDRYQGKEEKWIRDQNSHVKTGITDESPWYNFDDAVKVENLSLGLNYTLTDQLSVYAVTAGGVNPNTGVRDGMGDSIEPETTRSIELGFKFDYKMISGTVSIFRISRENAIWNYSNAPNPSFWEGGNNPFVGGLVPPDPGMHVARGIPRSYGFNYHLYFKPRVEGTMEGEPLSSQQWLEKLGLRAHPVIPGRVLIGTDNGPALDTDGRYDDSNTPVPGSIVQITRADTVNQSVEDLTIGHSYVFITYEALRNDPDLRRVALEAIEDWRNGNHPDTVSPLAYFADSRFGAGASEYIMNASASRGANVTFEEEATGIDAQLIFTPSSNLQFILQFSRVEREVTSPFNLVQAQANPGVAEDGTVRYTGPLGTEFDVWALDFGWDAFDWDGSEGLDPTKLKTGMIGQSLYYGAKDNANLWGRYTFNEGPLEGFGLGLGLRYRGPAQTFVPIGNSNQTANKYPTPDTEGHVLMDGAIYYSKNFKRFGLRLALNVYNLTDKRRLYSETAYERELFNSQTGLTEVHMEKRRTEIPLAPIHWRLSCTISF